jgi:phosphopantothenoylcysteine decarboxylase/phosphopantothenate--cysteine ligase
MNKQMWENPATQRNVKQLIADNISILGPDSGEQACGEVGLGRMLEAETLLGLVNAYFMPKLLTGKHILITAGATIEMIDPVRGITNLSSGKMGYAIAQVAADMGAEVTLVSGITALNAPTNAINIKAESAQAMYNAVMNNVINQDIFIAVAAVADYRPAIQHREKIKKSTSTLTLQLTPNRDILADVASLPNPPFCVGFAAETKNLLEYAEAKRKAKKLPLIVANLVNDAMGSDENSVTLLDKNGAHVLPRAPKTDIARLLLLHLVAMQ